MPPLQAARGRVWRALVDEFVVDLKARCETGEWSTEDERKRRERQMREDEEKHAKEEEKRQKREREVRARKEAEERAEEEAERNLDPDVRAIRSYLSRLPGARARLTTRTRYELAAGRWLLLLAAGRCSPLAPRASSRLVSPSAPPPSPSFRFLSRWQVKGLRSLRPAVAGSATGPPLAYKKSAEDGGERGSSFACKT